MSILLFYYALFFAITCVVAAPTGTATAIPGGSLENIEDFLVETTFHRVTKYHGTKPRWSDPEDRKLDDVIKFKKNGGILRVAYTRPIRVRQNRIDPLHLQQWCLDQNGVEQGKKYFENDNNYIPVNRLRLGGPIPLAGSWVDSKIFSLDGPTTFNHATILDIKPVENVPPVDDQPWRFDKVLAKDTVYVRAPTSFWVTSQIIQP